MPRHIGLQGWQTHVEFVIERWFPVVLDLQLGWLALPVQQLIVRKQLLEIFRFRRKVIADRQGWVRALQDDVRIQRL